jgi:hypothetical protein
MVGLKLRPGVSFTSSLSPATRSSPLLPEGEVMDLKCLVCQDGMLAKSRTYIETSAWIGRSIRLRIGAYEFSHALWRRGNLDGDRLCVMHCEKDQRKWMCYF